MIQANELRIGNWIKTNGFFNMLDAGLLSHLLRICAEGKSDILAIEPIPLTPELLEKCGFVDASDGYSATGVTPAYKINLPNGKVLTLYNHYSISEDYWHLPHYDNKVSHLHQLQNLYFALTGEELNISL